MANSVVRLNIESNEFDAKLKKAGDALNKYFDIAKKGDRTFEVLDEGVMDVIKAMGKMETSSKSAKGQLSELQKAFTDLSLIYKRFTEQEKASPVGKGMAKSLDELKARINETKGNIAEVTTELNGGGGGGGLMGALDAVASKFGLNIQQLAGWGAAIGAAKVVLDVAKDAFFASEATVDEWGRVMDSSRSLYEGFLTAINTGDISGYLSRIDEIVSAARTAYDELDRLGTMKTIQAPQMSAQQTENDRIRQMIQTGRYIAPLDGRKPAPGMKEGQLLTPEQIRTLERQLQNGMKTVVGLIGNEVKQTGKAIDAVYERQAKELGMSLSEFRKGTSSMAEFDKRMKDYQRYLDYENEHSTLIRTSYGTRTVRDNTANPYEGAQKWATFRVDGDRYNELVQLILQRDQQAAQAYGMQSQAYRAINRAEGITTRTILGDKSPAAEATYELLEDVRKEKPKVYDFMDATSNVTTSMKDLQQQLKLYKDLLANATTQGEYQTATSGIADIQERIAAQPKALELGVTIPEAEVITQVESLRENLESYFKENPFTISVGQNLTKEGKNADKAWQQAASAVQSVGQAFNQIEDPGVKAMGTVMQAIASIALGFAQASAQASSMGPWAWLAFLAAGMAATATTIATVHSLTGFAEGGIVPGNSFSGDNLHTADYGINSGELILNKAQQSTLASQLQDSEARGAESRPYVTGEKLVLGINNWAKSTGRGQLVFSKS